MLGFDPKTFWGIQLETLAKVFPPDPHRLAFKYLSSRNAKGFKSDMTCAFDCVHPNYWFRSGTNLAKLVLKQLS